MNKKTKIVFIINSFSIGGAERLLFDIIHNFDMNKFEVKIVTVLGLGQLESNFRELGIPIYSAGVLNNSLIKQYSRLYWLLSAPVTLIRITFFLFKSKPDIVVTSLYQADILGMIASRLTRVKNRIIIQHDVVRFKKIAYFLKKIFAINFSTKIISVSNTVKNFMVDYFNVKSDNIVVIYNGVDYSRFKEGIKNFFDIKNPIIGVVGRMEEIKGHIYIFEAFKILKEEHNLSPVVILAGNGSLKPDLEKYKKENNLTNFEFKGSISDVPLFLSQIDILIVPSISEGFGLAVIEGMISGKLVIASDIQAIREIIKDNENGLLFKSQSSSALVEVILNILSNKENIQRIERNALLFVDKYKDIFDIKEVSGNYQRLFYFSQ